MEINTWKEKVPPQAQRKNCTGKAYEHFVDSLLKSFMHVPSISILKNVYRLAKFAILLWSILSSSPGRPFTLWATVY